MSNKNRRRGKDYERWLAQDLGGLRIGILGYEDVILRTGWSAWSIECKETQRLPAIIRKGMAQAIANAKRNGNRPLLCIHEHSGRHEDDAVVLVMTYRDAKESGILHANSQ